MDKLTNLSRLCLHPMAVLTGALAGFYSSYLFLASFLGFLGLFMALSLAVVAKIWLEEALIKDILDHS